MWLKTYTLSLSLKSFVDRLPIDKFFRDLFKQLGKFFIADVGTLTKQADYSRLKTFLKPVSPQCILCLQVKIAPQQQYFQQISKHDNFFVDYLAEFATL